MSNKLKIRAHFQESPQRLSSVWAEILVDEVPLVEHFQHYAIHLQSLVSSQYSAGEYFIITCTCGHAGCAGIEKPIQVTHENGYVQWVVQNLSPVQTYRFEQPQYQSAIERGVKAIRGWFTAHPETLTDYENRVLIGYFPDLAPPPQNPSLAKESSSRG